MQTESRHAPRAVAATGVPLLGLTMAGDGALSARLWEKKGSDYKRHACESVRVIGGSGLRVFWDDALRPAPQPTASQVRTISAWGPEIQASLSRLRVAIVGAGSIGALVAEALARTGVERIVLIDFDGVEVVNLDRLLHARPIDARLRRAKVAVLRRGLLDAATAVAPQITGCDYSVVEDDGFRAALDCDVIFSCVDRPWPRAALNFVAYAHLIPVIDVGLRLRTLRSGRLRTAFCAAHTAGPDRRCLECLGQYEPGDVAVEREGSLDREEYIKRLPADSPLRARQNVFSFSLGAAGFAMSQFVSIVVAPGGEANLGAQRYDFKLGTVGSDHSRCENGCVYAEALGLGDAASQRFQPTGAHAAAVAARADRVSASRRPRIRAGRFVDDNLWLLQRKLFG